MTLEFKRNILSLLFHRKTDYIFILPNEFFDDIYHQAIFQLLKAYRKEYTTLPNIDNFFQFITTTNLQPEIVEKIKPLVEELYEPLEDTAILEHNLVFEIKKEMFKILTRRSFEHIEKGLSSEFIMEAYKQIGKIHSLSLDDTQGGGFYVISEMYKIIKEERKVYPHFLEGLNATRSLRGFYAPELYVLLGPPKAFKTGFLIKTAVEHMKSGENVFYGDFENGEITIGRRIQQCLLECRIDEIQSFSDELDQIRDKLMGLTGAGDIFIKKYKKKQDNFTHVDEDLERMLDKGMDPSMAIVDYIDIMGCHKKNKDKRLDIQENYAYADTINNKYNMFMWTVSKMKQSALKKEYPEPEDVAEDFEKIYNAHGVFALMRSTEDIEDGTGRMTSVVQREGDTGKKISVDLKIVPEFFTFEEL